LFPVPPVIFGTIISPLAEIFPSTINFSELSKYVELSPPIVKFSVRIDEPDNVKAL